MHPGQSALTGHIPIYVTPHLKIHSNKLDFMNIVFKLQLHYDYSSYIRHIKDYIYKMMSNNYKHKKK